MPKRTIHRLTAAACVTAAGCAAHSSAPRPAPTEAAPVVAAMPTTLPATLPTSMPVETTTTAPAAVITAPASKPSSAMQSQSFATATLAKTAATSPTTSPATAPVVEAAPLHPAPPSTQPADIAGDAALAERLCGLAQSSVPLKLPSNELWPAIWQQSGAMLSAACKLDPKQARFARLLADVLLQSNDDLGAIDALGKVRTADPADQGAQTQVIDLYANRMETAVQKIAYLKDLLGRPSLPEAIRSHAGVSCAALLLERGETGAATNVLNEALRLNPYNAAGFRLRLQTLGPSASNFERCEALMEILRASPAQPEIAANLADRLASAGIVEDSIPWYNLAARLYVQQGQPNLDLELNLACEFFIAGQTGAAGNLVDQLCVVSPGASGNWFLKVILAHARGGDAAYQQAINQATNAMGNQLLTLLRGEGQPAPATRPIDAAGAFPLPDLQAAVDQILKSKPSPADKQKRQQVQFAMADLATLQVYFAQKPGDAAGLIAALKRLNPADPVVDRLEGYSALYTGRTAEAKSSFEKCRGKDPLGELGLIRLQAMDPAAQQSAALVGRELLNTHPSGLLGVFLLDGLRDLRVEIIPSKEADALKQQIETFPTDSLQVVTQPQNFYALRTEPISLARNYRQPLLARLTVVNLTDNPLPIGPDGVLKPDLYFNAHVRGLDEKQFGAIAYDRLAGPLVLGPRQSCSQTVRLDQGPLQQLLDDNFSQTIEVVGDVMTNPQMAANTQVACGPGGYRVNFAHPFSRNAEPLDSAAPQKALSDLSNGQPGDKFAAVDLLGAYLQYIAKQDPNDPNLHQLAGTFEDALHKAAGDPVAAVSAWAVLTSLQASPSAQNDQQLTDLAQDADWRHRQVSLVAARDMGDAEQKRIATLLKDDPEPSVRAAAEASLKYLDVISTIKK